MSWRVRTHGAKFFHLIEGDERKTRKMQPAVKEHRAMPRAEDEAITIQPARFLGIETECVAEQHCADFSAAERQAKVAGRAGMNGVHGEASGFVGGTGESGEIKWHGGLWKMGREGARRAQWCQESYPLEGRNAVASARARLPQSTSERMHSNHAQNIFTLQKHATPPLPRDGKLHPHGASQRGKTMTG
jgi:hypothetical protein